MIATSDDWGVSKPDPEFFRALANSTPCAPHEIVYVGDRIDNDLKPAKEAGMRTAFIRRGPWGYILENHPDMTTAADWRITTLADLPGLLGSSAG
jgi:FMN phosphatase YigB (HAD superfamily)